MNAKDYLDGKIGTLCNCCGCCCVFLDSKKRLGFHTISPSSYRSRVNVEACNGCAACEEICQTEAIRVGEGAGALVEEARCIGCGLCVSCCPEDAVRLLALLGLPNERSQPGLHAQSSLYIRPGLKRPWGSRDAFRALCTCSRAGARGVNTSPLRSPPRNRVACPPADRAA